MSGSVILDSNALIALFDGQETVAAALREAGRVLVPAIVHGEIMAGCQGTTRREMRTRELLERLLSKPAVSILPATKTTGDFYGRVFAFLRSRGTPMPTNDIWIAAGALETGAAICTNDAHLLRLPLIKMLSF